MAKYQFLPLKDEKKFEELVCDILNYLESTDTYRNTDFQFFGVKGQAQKGIDIVSSKSQTVVQCKLKDLRKTDSTIRKALYQDIDDDLDSIAEIQFTFKRVIFASTFRDDAKLQEYVNIIKEKNDWKYDIYYWGWDTISKYIEEFEYIRDKFYPEFKPKKAKTKPKLELPEEALGKHLNEKNYIDYLKKRYGDWKQIELSKKGEKFNWGAFTISITKKYKASGLNYINICYFEDLVIFLQGKIDNTIMGKVNRSKGIKNYSTFEESITLNK